jgi:hypothetical protein
MTAALTSYLTLLLSCFRKDPLFVATDRSKTLTAKTEAVTRVNLTNLKKEVLSPLYEDGWAYFLVSAGLENELQIL